MVVFLVANIYSVNKYFIYTNVDLSFLLNITDCKFAAFELL